MEFYKGGSDDRDQHENVDEGEGARVAWEGVGMVGMGALGWVKEPRGREGGEIVAVAGGKRGGMMRGV